MGIAHVFSVLQGLKVVSQTFGNPPQVDVNFAQVGQAFAKLDLVIIDACDLSTMSRRSRRARR